MRASIAIAALLLGSASPAAAWDVGLNENNDCYAWNAFDGPGTTMLTVVGGDPSGPLLMSVANENWSIGVGDKVDLVVSLDDATVPVAATGMGAGGHHGFFFQIDASFLRQFRAARMMRVNRGAIVVDELSLAGSSDAVQRLLACMFNAREVMTRDSRRQQQPFGSIPLDPFASEVPAPDRTEASPSGFISALGQWRALEDTASETPVHPAPRKLGTVQSPRPSAAPRTIGGAGPFANCAAARAAGAAPVRIGDPGYSRRLDRDGDGVGCE